MESWANADLEYNEKQRRRRRRSAKQQDDEQTKRDIKHGVGVCCLSFWTNSAVWISVAIVVMLVAFVGWHYDSPPPFTCLTGLDYVSSVLFAISIVLNFFVLYFLVGEALDNCATAVSLIAVHVVISQVLGTLTSPWWCEGESSGPNAVTAVVGGLFSLGAYIVVAVVGGLLVFAVASLVKAVSTAVRAGQAAAEDGDDDV